jgi:hypothetical protein
VAQAYLSTQFASLTWPHILNNWISCVGAGRSTVDLLHSLAELYAVSDENLMERAGCVVPTRSRSNVEQRYGGVATFADPRAVAQFAALHKAGPLSGRLLHIRGAEEEEYGLAGWTKFAVWVRPLKSLRLG